MLQTVESAVARRATIGPIDIGVFDIDMVYDCYRPVLPGVRFENWSAKAVDVAAPFDPARPTLVIIHGGNVYGALASCGVHFWPETFARAIRPAVGDAANIMVCRYDEAAQGLPEDVRPHLPGVARALSDFLLANGLDHDLQLICHSAGAIIACDVVMALGYVAQLTLLEPAEEACERMLATWDDFASRVGFLENYWLPGPFGIGFDLRSAENVTNVIVLSNFSNGPGWFGHFAPVVWYQQTSRVPEAVGGFRWSLVGGAQRCAGTDFIEYQGLMFARPADGSMSGLTDELHPAVHGLLNAVADRRLPWETAPQIADELGLTFVGP